MTGSSVPASNLNSSGGSTRNLKYMMGMAAMNAAPAGDGRPLKYWCDSSSSSVCTLNRANRKATHMTKNTAADQPKRSR